MLLYISGSLYWIFTENYLAEPSLVEAHKCPVCFGESLCNFLLTNRVHLSSTARLTFLDIFGTNSNRVHYATLETESQGHINIVIKRLGKNHDISDLDALICSKSKMDDCDVAVAISKLSFVRKSSEDSTFAKYLQGTSKMFYCPSTRLVSELFNKYHEKSATDHVTVRDKIKIWSTATINQEPLLLQVNVQVNLYWPSACLTGTN